MELIGRTALVTGAGANIGRATARTLAAEGAAVVCFDIRTSDAQETAARILGAGGRALAIGGDVRVPGDVGAALDAAEASFGIVDIVVNNAAIYITKSLLDIELDDWRRTLDVSLTGPFIVSQAAVRRMVAAGKAGAIVNLASGAGRRGTTNAIAYNAAKGGVINLTRAMAVELGPKKIRVNSISPARTGTVTGTGAPDEPRREHHPDPGPIPLGRLGDPQDIADAVVFLVSDRARFITGVDLAVDGGTLAGVASRPPAASGGVGSR